MYRWTATLASLAIWPAAVAPVGAQPKPTVTVDCTDPAVAAQWHPTNDVRRIESTADGMVVEISGPDPYITGPVVAAPTARNLWLHVRLRSSVGGTLQVFYFTTNTTERDSVRASVAAGRWVDVTMPLPPLHQATRLRLDPPGIEGTCTFAQIGFSERRQIIAPRWGRPILPRAGRIVALTSATTRLEHDQGRLGTMTVRSGGVLVAAGWGRIPVGYMQGEEARWIDLAAGKAKVVGSGGAIVARSTTRDPDGARWTIEQRFAAAKHQGAIDATTTITVDKPRTVLFAPMLALFPGFGSYGAARERGLLAGVEYLDPPDKSSSEDDLVGERAERLVPKATKLTFPLMTVQARSRWVALTWRPTPWLSAAYDSPDRSFGSGSNAMAVLFPGSDGYNRREGSLTPYWGRLLEPGYRLRLDATILAGSGASILPSVQAYVKLRGLPAVPKTGMDRTAFARWTAGGWLDSKIRVDAMFRHAYWPGISGFGPVSVADAGAWMEWLAECVGEPALASRLRQAAAEAVRMVEPAAYNQASVSHVTYPVQSLLYGSVQANARRATEAGRGLLQRFNPEGLVLYQPGETDYGRTHFEKHANGLTAQVVASLLVHALVSGDATLREDAIRRLRGLDRYTNSAPRGAQTWEVPLHTPDILGSAHLVKAYTIGYELTGEPAFLAKAKHWAWTGVPFVYLTAPTTQAVGLYATTPVLGATAWTAPNWIGLPVQWCGLVYADALYRLQRYDPNGPWKRIADGIAASGVQQSWPTSDKDLQALLPDSFTFDTQTRNAVAINPGTLQSCAVRLFGGPEMYDYHVFRRSGFVAHAPGSIVQARETDAGVSFVVQGWRSSPSWVLVPGVHGSFTATVDGLPADLAGSETYDRASGCLALRFTGRVAIEIRR